MGKDGLSKAFEQSTGYLRSKQAVEHDADKWRELQKSVQRFKDAAEEMSRHMEAFGFAVTVHIETDLPLNGATSRRKA